MPVEDSRSFRLGVLLAFVAALGFATKGILIKWAYASGIGAEALLALRMLFATALLASVRLLRKGDSVAPFHGLTATESLSLVALGFLGYYLSSWLDFRGLELIPASVERLVLLLYPTFTVVLSALLLRRKQPLLVWIALPVCYGGLLLVLGKPAEMSTQTLHGVLWVFGSTLSYALYLVYSPGLIARMGSMRFAEDVIFVSTAMVLVHAFAAKGPDLLAHLPAHAWFWGLALGLLSTTVPMYALSGAIARIGSPRTSLIGMAGPLFTILLAALLLGESLTPVQLVGAAVILLGVYLAGKK